MNNQKIAEEIIRLQDACFCYAKEIIKSKQVLLPFAAFLNTSHEITIEDPPHNAKVNKKRIEQLLNESLMLVTALAPKIGYDNASKIAKTAHKNGTNLKEETLKTGLINEKDYMKIMNPKKMTHPK